MWQSCVPAPSATPSPRALESLGLGFVCRSMVSDLLLGLTLRQRQLAGGCPAQESSHSEAAWPEPAFGAACKWDFSCVALHMP